ncbi:unnamed protein product [Cylicocyclus nassatus]|uniref:Uncharacterized protein n=1 Tax=Cylicocyclus nassatus TaxID=53992 RepID=A0AA36MEZ5_CYLNA|nr:unnamed protein product [Cylicocyclus nassatus]
MVSRNMCYLYTLVIASGVLVLYMDPEITDAKEALQAFGHAMFGLETVNKPVFLHKPETKHISCGRILSGDKAYIKDIVRKRPVLQHRWLDMSCNGIRARILPPKPLEKLDFGVAYARIVYEDYEFIEDEVRSSYHPQNIFCFSVDAKQKNEFYSKIFALSICVPNVLLAQMRYGVNSAGHNMNQAHYDCLKLLSKQKGWQYVLLLQNHDMMIKTVYETVAILKELGGANDICVRQCEPNRWNHSAEWDASSLKLFRNESQATPTQLATNLTIVRGLVQCSLSRAAVEWAVNTVDLTTLINQLNTNAYAVDETLWAVLQMSDDLQMPGRFTGKCISSKTYVPCITRVTFWSWHKQYFQCPWYRHGICIFGVENLQRLSMIKGLVANKPFPSFDYALINCVHELLFNRTYLGQVDQKLDLQFYRSLENVRYHKNALNPDPAYKLHCPTYHTWDIFMGHESFLSSSFPE